MNYFILNCMSNDELINWCLNNNRWSLYYRKNSQPTTCESAWNQVKTIKAGDIVFLYKTNSLVAYGYAQVKKNNDMYEAPLTEIPNQNGGIKESVFFVDTEQYYTGEYGEKWNEQLAVDLWRKLDEPSQGIQLERGQVAKCLNQEQVTTIRKIIFMIDDFCLCDFETSKNLILTGAPGTGKTYLAKKLANYITEHTPDDDLSKNDRVAFVQFHPSYDYTDFVEGLRPIDDATNLTFRRKDGIFMNFCRNALEEYNKAENKDKAKKFVFIIDEINRGDLSKIFGELFFSIDPSYRGKAGRIKTQYCNLWKEDDFFDGSDTFYIPNNVYIIGTMNDIDRSVECMDFAMRRRFAFKEITATDSLEIIQHSEKLKEFYDHIQSRFNNLNLCILTIQGLSSAYQIGGAYFLKLENYLDNNQLNDSSWEKLWNYHLKGLLFEYLRGLANAGEELDKLYHAYSMSDKYELKNGMVEKLKNE